MRKEKQVYEEAIVWSCRAYADMGDNDFIMCVEVYVGRGEQVIWIADRDILGIQYFIALSLPRIKQNNVPKHNYTFFLHRQSTILSWLVNTLY